MARLDLHPDRMLPADPTLRPLAREIYQAVRGEGINVRSDKGDRFVPLSSIAWFDLDTSNPTPAEPAPKARAAK